VEDANIFDINANEVEINFNMLRALMLYGVGGEVDHTDVVAVDQGGPWWGALQLLKKPMEPARLRHAVGHNEVLRLITRTRDDVLTLRGLGDKVDA
jgi:hypothetical protein